MTNIDCEKNASRKPVDLSALCPKGKILMVVNCGEGQVSEDFAFEPRLETTRLLTYLLTYLLTCLLNCLFICLLACLLVTD